MAAETTSQDVLNLDLVYDLADTDRRGHPLAPGVRRDRLSGRLFYSSGWLRERATSVGTLPGPDEDLVLEANRAAESEPRDAGGARAIALQASTLPADRYIGPRRTMLGLVPTEEIQVRLAAAFLVAAVRAAQRSAERLAEVAGFDSPTREQAEGAARGLARLAERVEGDTHG